MLHSVLFGPVRAGSHASKQLVCTGKLVAHLPEAKTERENTGKHIFTRKTLLVPNINHNNLEITYILHVLMEDMNEVLSVQTRSVIKRLNSDDLHSPCTCLRFPQICALYFLDEPG
jgi:hypothetical protein